MERELTQDDSSSNPLPCLALDRGLSLPINCSIKGAFSSLLFELSLQDPRSSSVISSPHHSHHLNVDRHVCMCVCIDQRWQVNTWT